MMKQSPFTIKYTMMMVKDIENRTGKPVSMTKRHEMQNLLLQWYFSLNQTKKVNK